MKRIAVVQPVLTQYRMPVFLELSQYCPVDLFFSPTTPGLGFGDLSHPEAPNIRYFEVPTVKLFGDRIGMIQRGVTGYLLRERPDAILIFANPRYVTFWTTLLLGRLCRIRVFAHGHGLYKWSHINLFYRFVVRLMLRLVTSYIAYAPLVRESFAAHGFSDKKVSVAHNTLLVPSVVRPEEKSGSERGVLFVGRLRRDSNLGLLLKTIDRLRQNDGIELTVHIIGTGECATQLREEYCARGWIRWHGEVYEHTKIREVSQDCFVGCHPGDAGLSVVHMMALSLPVITHDEPSRQGPEPSFIQDGVSGILYDHDLPEESLYRALKVLAQQPARVAQMQRGAFERYRELTNPSLALRLWGIIGEERQA